jgi:hypothetical protein
VRRVGPDTRLALDVARIGDGSAAARAGPQRERIRCSRLLQLTLWSCRHRARVEPVPRSSHRRDN